MVRWKEVAFMFVNFRFYIYNGNLKGHAHEGSNLRPGETAVR